MPRSAARQLLGPGLPRNEEAFLQQVKELALRTGFRFYHTRRSGWVSDKTGRVIGSDPGWVDVALCKPPVLGLFELKLPGGAPTPAQHAWLSDLAAVRRLASGIWTPDDWEPICRFFGVELLG